MKPLAALLLAALAAAPLAAAPPPPAKTYSDRMAGLSEIQRFAAIRRAIQDNGLWCPRVIGAAYQQPIKNLVMWVARCGPNGPQAKTTLAGTPVRTSGDYGLFIGPDGSVQASDCAEIVKVGWPACRRLPPAPRRIR